MFVSVRNIGSAALLVLGLSTAAPAHAQACCAPVNRPKPPVQTGCCISPDVQVNVPTARISGASVNAPGVAIAAPAVAVAASSASASAAASGSVSAGSSSAGASFGGVQGWSASGGYAGEYYGGGGYGYTAGYEGGGVDGGGFSTLEVAGKGAGSAETAGAQAQAQVQAAASSGKMIASGLRPVMASCISEETKRNGAIGIYPQTQVDPDYDGELYRCSAGQRMVAWLGAMTSGRADFAAADAFSCRVGDAIWHALGGRLSCRPASETAAAAKRGATDELLGTHTLSGVRLVMVSPAAAAAMSAAPQAPAATRPTQAMTGRTEIQGNLNLGSGVGAEAW